MVKVHQEHGARPAIPLILPTQLVRQPFIMKVQAHTRPAGPVVINHSRPIQRGQNVLCQCLMDLAIIDVRRIYRACFPAFPQDEKCSFPRFPFPAHNLPAALCRPGKQVALKVLCALFPPDTVAAFPPIEKHIVIAKGPFFGSYRVAAGLSVCLPPFLAALISRLAALVACHSYSPAPYR